MDGITVYGFLAFFSWLGSFADQLPDNVGDLIAAVAPPINCERRLSMEEIRLNQFWRGYYAAVARFNEEMGKLDWVAYYKNHGVQTNDGNQCITYGSVVVVPQL